MADIRIDRYEEDLAGTSGTITITDVGSTSSAFVRITGSSRQDSAGQIGFTSNSGPDDVGIRLELTGTNEVTYTKQLTNTVKVMFEVWVYTGSPGGAYEFISRQRGTASLTGSSVTAAVSGLTDRNDCVPVFTGWTTSEVSNSNWEMATVACHLNSSSQVEFSRTNSGTTVVCAYDVVEFTGSAWNVGCALSSNHDANGTHFTGGEVVTMNTDSSGAGGATFDVTDWGTAMIVQGSMGGDSSETGLSDTLMYFLPGPSTTQLRCTLDNTASRNDSDAYAYVIQCDDLVVNRTTSSVVEGNNTYGTNLAAPSGYSYATPITEMALEWFPGTNGEGTAHARGALHAQIIDTGSAYQVQHWIHRSGNDVEAAYAFADFSALVDTPPPVGTGFQAKRWDGATYNNVVVKGWGGSSWIEAKFWDGVAWIGGGAPAQNPGGFIENPSGATARGPVTDFSFLPSGVGEFDFPAPWNTRGIRLIDSESLGGNAFPVDYAYWRVSNNHVGSDIMKIMVRLPEAQGGPSIVEYNKVTGAVSAPVPIFDVGVLYRNPTGFANAYFSATDPNKMYWAYEGGFYSIDVSSLPLSSGDVTTVFAGSQTGAGNKLWQSHSTNDDRYHAMTYRTSGYSALGAVVYDEVLDTFQTYPSIGSYDECQIDKNGAYLVIKENVDAAQGEDNRIIRLSDGNEVVLNDLDGAGGHSDLGYDGWMVNKNNYAVPSNPGVIEVRDLSAVDPSVGTRVYTGTSWSLPAVPHISWCHAKPASEVPIANQYIVGGGVDTPDPDVHENEIIAVPLDGTEDCLMIAPSMSTSDSGADQGQGIYGRFPKGNTDITGEYFIWSSNRGGSAYMDIFMVKIPKHLLGNAP